MLETLINGNDLYDLDSDLGVIGVIDLVHTYIAYEYGDVRQSLRSSNGYFNV